MTVTIVSHARRILNSRLLRLSAWYTISNLLARALAFLLVPVYATIMTPDAIGQTALTLTWAGVFTIGATLYLYTVPDRARADFADDDYDDLISALTSLGMFVSAIFMLILLILPVGWFHPFFGVPKSLVILAAAFVPLTFPFRMILTRWQGESQASRFAKVVLIFEFMTAVCSIAFIVLPQQLDHNFNTALGRITAVMGVRAAFGFYFLTKTFNGLIYVRKYWGYALGYVLPMLPHALAGELLANYDRVIIAQYYGDNETGIYSVLYQVGTVVALLAATSAAAFSPWYYRHMTDQQFELVRNQTRRYLLGFTALTSVLIVCGVPIANLILPKAYAEGSSIIPIIMASGYFSLLHYFFLFIQSQARKTWFASIATLVTAGVNIGLNLLLVPRVGYLVASWTTLISYIVLFGLHVAVVRLRFKNDNVNDLRLMIMLGTGIIVLATLVSVAA